MFSLRRDGNAQLDSYEGMDHAVVIPADYEGHPVTVIADNAFSWQSSIQSVVIPETVTVLGEAAFSWCESLRSVSIPASVRVIGEWCFIGCSDLQSVVVPPSVKKINYSTFQSCVSLTSISLPSQLQSIGPEAFSECRSLKKIDFPASLKSIGECAFASCESLSTLRLPDQLTEIGTNAFSGCSSLDSFKLSENHPVFLARDGVLMNHVERKLLFYPFHRRAKTYEVPDGILTIGEEAFAGCVFLESVILPSSVSSSATSPCFTVRWSVFSKTRRMALL